MRRVLGPKSIVKELEILKQVSDDARQHNIEKDIIQLQQQFQPLSYLYFPSLLHLTACRKRLPVMEIETEK